jgi:hypothetical protein
MIRVIDTSPRGFLGDDVIITSPKLVVYEGYNNQIPVEYHGDQAAWRLVAIMRAFERGLVTFEVLPDRSS